jgi:hypothetical protein
VQKIPGESPSFGLPNRDGGAPLGCRQRTAKSLAGCERNLVVIMEMSAVPQRENQCGS